MQGVSVCPHQHNLAYIVCVWSCHWWQRGGSHRWEWEQTKGCPVFWGYVSGHHTPEQGAAGGYYPFRGEDLVRHTMSVYCACKFYQVMITVLHLPVKNSFSTHSLPRQVLKGSWLVWVCRKCWQGEGLMCCCYFVVLFLSLSAIICSLYLIKFTLWIVIVILFLVYWTALLVYHLATGRSLEPCFRTGVR